MQTIANHCQPSQTFPEPAAVTRDAPAFDFYPERWLVGVAMLSDAEQISYLRLLCHQWTVGDAGLPADAAALKRLAGKGVTPTLLAKFPVGSDGRRRNRRLEIVRAAQRKRIQEASEKGRRMAEGRWKDKRDMPPQASRPARDETPAGTGTPAAAASASANARENGDAGTVAAGPPAACAEQAGFTGDVRGRPGPAGGDASSGASARKGAGASREGHVEDVSTSAAAGVTAAGAAAARFKYSVDEAAAGLDARGKAHGAADGDACLHSSAGAAEFQRSVDEAAAGLDARGKAHGSADGDARIQRGAGAAGASAAAADSDACAMHKQCMSNAHHSPPTTHLPKKESESNAQAGADRRQGSDGREGQREDNGRREDKRQGQQVGRNDGEGGAATLAEVKAYAPTVMAPDGCAETFWNDCQATGWVNRHGQPIVQWQPLFRNYATQWKARLSCPQGLPRRAGTVRNDTANKPGRYA